MTWVLADDSWQDGNETQYLVCDVLSKVFVWMAFERPVSKCFPAAPSFLGPKHVVVKFVVKFFPPDHTQLQEELTRLVVWKLGLYGCGAPRQRERSYPKSADKTFALCCLDQPSVFCLSLNRPFSQPCLHTWGLGRGSTSLPQKLVSSRPELGL